MNIDWRKKIMANSELLSRTTARSDVFGGKTIVRDMRVSVELILSLLAQGITPETILEDYPGLEPEDIRACTACWIGPCPGRRDGALVREVRQEHPF